jgi:hypothetical protein
VSRIAEIRKQIEAAIEAVKGYDEPYRTKAFEVILSKSIEYPLTEKGAKLGRPTEKLETPTARIQRFAQDAQVSVEQLENVFEFGRESLKVIAPLHGSLPEKQASFAQCLLIGLERVYQRKTLPAPELARMLDDYGLSAKNLARSLKSRSDIFRKVGKKKETKYKLTDVGKTGAIELVKTMATSTAQS